METQQDLAERFKEYCGEHSLKPKDTAEFEQQLAALSALHEWLKTGVDSAEVIIRAVQVLLLEPEQPGVHRRPAARYVLKQVANQWKSAGLEERDVALLRGMLLCAWPSSAGKEAFKLTHILSPAFTATASKADSHTEIVRWLHNQPAWDAHPPFDTTPFDNKSLPNPLKLEEPTLGPEIESLSDLSDRHGRIIPLGTAVKPTIIKHHEILSELTSGLKNAHNTLEHIEKQSLTKSDLGASPDNIHSKLDLLWWGQARYSPILRRSYRQLKDQHERLWWMAWEASGLSLKLDVEPAASFLVETLREAGLPVHEQHALKDLLLALFKILRSAESSQQNITMGQQLTKLANEEPIGLPVTWTRLQAANPRVSEVAFEQSLGERVALNLDTRLDLGDWAAWVFRECLLDRHLGAK